MRPWPGSNGDIPDFFYKYVMPLASKNLCFGNFVLFIKYLIQIVNY